ncbi:MAG: hypothetical protein AAF438_10125 [Pseudomonadota bacterium]
MKNTVVALVLLLTSGFAHTEELEQRVLALEDLLSELELRLETLRGNTALELDGAVSLEGDTVHFSGVNVQIVNGLGATTEINGLGNLVIGYDEPAVGNELPNTCSDGYYKYRVDCLQAGQQWSRLHKSGSHNIVLGTKNNYSQYSGIVAGTKNIVNAPYSSITAGVRNRASGFASHVSGGEGNLALGPRTVVVGGSQNTAGDSSGVGPYAVVLGGQENWASVSYASVVGGKENIARGPHSAILGGEENIIDGGLANAIAGGFRNNVQGHFNVLSGGYQRDIPVTARFNWRAGSLHVDDAPAE